jgi:hypothetical protein
VIDVAYWHFSAVPTAPSNVGYLGWTGRHMLKASSSHFGPTRVPALRPQSDFDRTKAAAQADKAEMKPTTIHPVDELAKIKAQMCILAAKESALRHRLLLAPAGAHHIGDKYKATINVFEHGELDRIALEQQFGKAAIAACERIVTHKVISLTRHRRSQRPSAASSSVLPIINGRPL